MFKFLERLSAKWNRCPYCGEDKRTEQCCGIRYHPDRTEDAYRKTGGYPSSDTPVRRLPKAPTGPAPGGRGFKPGPYDD